MMYSRVRSTSVDGNVLMAGQKKYNKNNNDDNNNNNNNNNNNTEPASAAALSPNQELSQQSSKIC